MKQSALLLVFASLLSCYNSFSQTITLTSPDNKIRYMLSNGDSLSYSVVFNDRNIIEKSALGFEFRGEKPMMGGFEITGKSFRSVDETWQPVVHSKHAAVINKYNEGVFMLREKTGDMRCMELTARAYNDGIAFRFRLYRSGKIGTRTIEKENTQFVIPGNPKAWVVEYNGGYHSSNESEFMEHPLNYVTDKTIAGMPFLMDYGNNCWVAITEARIENYAAFYIGSTGKTNQLTTKLVPLPDETETGAKVRFHDEVSTPWRVLMIGDSPGKLIESEILQNLNDPCAIADPTWIKPGMSAWDHWWSGEVKMEMPVIKQYIDMAATMGWPYMLVDWQWYGKFNTPEADITRWAPQIDMPEIIRYAASKNVKILIWLYSSDVNRNAAYKKAFPLYHQWGIAGIKIDFMDRDDQDMVNWYHDIIRCAAENQLLVDFHGAYKPDGIIRTWPNMITREGVMGNEYYKFSNNMSPEHNVKLAFTRMLAGQMDYTPGGFLNVRKDQFKQQVPALVWNTRAAELSKFVIYESPLTVVCDHPEHIVGKPGSEFLKIVPTTWDDIRFLGGYPGDYVAIAKRSGEAWFTGIMNDTVAKTVVISLDFLPPGSFELESWADTKNSDKDPAAIARTVTKVTAADRIKVALARNGGWVGVIRSKP